MQDDSNTLCILISGEYFTIADAFSHIGRTAV